MARAGEAMRLKPPSIALMVLLLLPPAIGQSVARLRGTVSVVGADNEPSYLAQVQLRLECDSNPAEVRTGKTDDGGQFVFSDLLPGRCTVKVIDSQFEETPIKVDIVAGQDSEVDVHAHVRDVRENVTVTGEQTQVDPSSSDTSANSISQATLQSAPLISERFQDALPLLPGVVRGPDGLINIKGARAGQSGSLVNSANAADPVTGEEAISLPLEAVASVKVLGSSRAESPKWKRVAGQTSGSIW